MIKKSVYILLLLGVVVTLCFAILNRKSTHTLLPIQPKQSVEITIEPDSTCIEADSVVVVDTLP